MTAWTAGTTNKPQSNVPDLVVRVTRVGVISDTHLDDTGEALAVLLAIAERHFRGVDMILHAGDIVAPDVLAAFAPSPVHAVRGNMDPAAPGLPWKRILDIDGCRIGLMHGWGPREGLVERLRKEFRDDALDCLIFGHSHVPVCHWVDGLLLFNPGSATDRRGMPYESVGVLEIDDGVIEGRIVAI